jgi:thioredoxin reductase (NADPH)
MKTGVNDLIIVGAGPAGLTASIYASRYKIEHQVLGLLSGGAMTEAYKICNFPSEVSISGWELAQKIENNAQHLGGKIEAGEVIKISGHYPNFQLELADGRKLVSKTILLASGAKRRHLGLPNEDKFLGHGLAYCATCDGPFFKDKIVGVVGGGNCAATAVIFLSAIAAQVLWFYLGSEPGAVEPSWLEEIRRQDNIKLMARSEIKALLGDNHLTGVTVDRENNTEDINLDGLFVEIGSTPNNGLLQQLGGTVNEGGYIVVDGTQTTTIPGVWAAGDVTTSSNGLRQIVTACSEGAIAADSIFKFLQQQT